MEGLIKTSCFIVVLIVGVYSKSLVFNFAQDYVHTVEHKDGDKVAKCGYESCNPVKDGMINVHLVPHTHDDVGWLKTVDQYYYGDLDSIQRAGVQYILDSVIPQLQNDPNKRFIYVEIAFFKRWWDQQHDSHRHLVKGLVNNGQLEFILGGWCMNDEASTHYNAIIDQHTLGFRFLQETFGDCARPRVAWQIDPFGHSREQASLFAQMGFDGLFFGRLDYQDKWTRASAKTLEMVWKGSANLGSVADLFTGVLPNNYNPPEGFCYDILCNDSPIMDDKRLHDYNVPDVVESFLSEVNEQAKAYATNHLIMTMGSDFQYSNANVWYKNLDKLIKYVNEQQTNGTKVNLLYSTPSCYLKQLNLANKTWTTKDDDFFPYSHRPHSFWTGYFTSRAALKGYVRQTNNFLQVCKQLDALALLEDTEHSSVSIQVLKEALAVAQHHDAVSGTEKQAVAYDYAERLADGIHECQKTVNDAYKKLLNKSSTVVPPDQLFCGLMNISMCDVTENNKQIVVVIYNPIGRLVDYWVRLPVTGSSFQVMGPDGKAVKTQLVSVSNRTKRIPERHSRATSELVFKATQLPPLGFATYFVQMTAGQVKNQHSKEDQLPRGEMTIKNEHISLTFDADGNLKNMMNLDSKISLPLTQQYAYYKGHSGNNTSSDLQASGAYVFRPNTSNPTVLKPSIVKRTKFVQGELVQEIEQVFSPWVSQVIRLYQGARHAEFEWTVGPIPVQDDIGKEVISRFQSDIVNGQVFYTDANGREMLERKIDYRPSWKFNQTEPVAGNYYPINSRIYIRDNSRKVQLTVLTDRSQGGTSLKDGQIEIMVHRRTLCDDALGVGEALNETGADGKGLIIRGKHYLMLETIEKSASLHRDMALQLYMSPSLSFVASPMKLADWSQKFRTSWSGLQQPLPANVHLLSLEQWQGKTYLVRLEHIYELNEDKNLSKPVNMTMKDLFSSFNVDSADELTLGGNLKSSDLQRLKWKTTAETESGFKKEQKQKSSSDTRDVTLTPMQIRTFQAAFTPRLHPVQ